MLGLPSHVAGFLRRHDLLHTSGIVAVSGGPDSVALAYLLVDLVKNGDLERVTIGHVNHQLRGAESDADENFVQQLPGLDADCRTTRIAVRALADAEHENLEAVARRERYAWLTQLAHDEKASWIATGHSADDQAETVLFRLLRGSGIQGLAGMPECRPVDGDIRLIRPLLSVRRAAIHEFVRQNAIPFRSDSSNQDRRFTRNRIRLDLLPLLEREYNVGMVDVLCGLAEQAGEVHGKIDMEARRLLTEAELPRAGDIVVFALDRLRMASTNLIRELFRLVWQREHWPMGAMDFEHWNRLVEIVAGTMAACDFPGGIHVRRVGKVVQIQQAPAQPS